MRGARKTQPLSPARRSKARYLFWAAVFFLLGVIGVIVPVMPQVPFFVMSLLFLSLVFPSVRRTLRRFLTRHPRIARAYKTWRDAARRKRQRVIRKEKELGGRLRRQSKIENPKSKTA